jgi:uncharacterized tellurite resistance protein B-like protein
MENKRYNFSGFIFGDNGLAVLNVQILNNTKVGTSYTTEIAIELTPEERQELITKLITIADKDKN